MDGVSKNPPTQRVANQIIVDEDPAVPGLMYVSQAVQGDGTQPTHRVAKRTETFPETETSVTHKRMKIEPDVDQSINTLGIEEVFKTEVQDKPKPDDLHPLLAVTGGTSFL